MATERDLFKNDTGGQIGVVTLDPGGKHVGIAVPPNGEIWLTKEEQVVTANAPQKDEDNPFTNGSLRAIAEGQEVATRRPLRPEEGAVQPSPPAPEEAAELPRVEKEAEETGAAPQPEGPAVQGQRAKGEEVGTPEAAQALPKREPQPAKPAPDPVRPAPDVKVPEPVAKR